MTERKRDNFDWESLERAEKWMSRTDVDTPKQ